MKAGGLLLAGMLTVLGALPAFSKTICTIVADARTDKVLLERGDCRSRFSPASTFKLPLALIGFDSGFLKDAHAPLLDYKKGDASWGGEAWRRPNDPASWMHYSVVWYSQRIAHSVGAQELTRYMLAFGYGNGDLSGDRGKNNGLDRSWISSSLVISPAEQVAFLGRLTRRDLGLSAEAYKQFDSVVEKHAAGGWAVQGKTGSFFPRKADGNFDRAKGYGWYIGWAERDGRRLVFARLNQDEREDKRPGGIRTRNAFLADLPKLASGL